MKTCTRCGETKAESEFYRIKQWFHGSCKRCHILRAKTWKQKNLTPDRKAWWTANRQAAKQRVKDEVFGAYGGYKCACCGETERTFLTLDHVNNDGAEWRRGKWKHGKGYAGHPTYTWLLRHNFPAGFQVLCMNCNWGKRMNKGVCPHQVKSNDYPLVGVGPSGPKRIAFRFKRDEEIVSSATKVAAVRTGTGH